MTIFINIYERKLLYVISLIGDTISVRTYVDIIVFISHILHYSVVERSLQDCLSIFFILKCLLLRQILISWWNKIFPSICSCAMTLCCHSNNRNIKSQLKLWCLKRFLCNLIAVLWIMLLFLISLQWNIIDSNSTTVDKKYVIITKKENDIFS